MSTTSNTTHYLGAALAAALLAAVAAQPVNAGQTIFVPTDPPDVKGCYKADRKLYGYNLQFCAERNGRGSYVITGQGAYCEARLSWDETHSGFRFDMNKAKCDGGENQWTADTFNCKVKTVQGSGGQVKALSCNYDPKPGGVHEKTFTAKRT